MDLAALPHRLIKPEKRGSGIELSDILNRYLPSYLQRHAVSSHQRQVLEAIRRCRTSELGGHVCQCDHCDHIEIAYNSCRNRHCPKCGGQQRLKWLKARLSELLPIPYYHVVFTLPHELNDLCLCNKAVIYDIFFHSASETLQAFAADEKYLGAKIGIIALLHSWGRSLCYHVHLHLIVTGGGISLDGQCWKALPYRQSFLFPVTAMSKVIRGKFIEKLKGAFEAGELNFPGKLSVLSSCDGFKSFLNQLWKKEWVNYVKAPFGDEQAVVAYTGEYANREAVSNESLLGIEHSEGDFEGVKDQLEYSSRHLNRPGILDDQFVSLEDDRVNFLYKNYRSGGKKEILSLGVESFIGRFLWHILPKGFQKIRYYGILASNCKKVCLGQAREFLSAKVAASQRRLEQLLAKISWGFSLQCPQCREGNLRVIGYLSREQLAVYYDSS